MALALAPLLKLKKMRITRTAIAVAMGCSLSLAGKPTMRDLTDVRALRVSLQVKDVPVSIALGQLFDAANLRVEVDPGIRGTVTVDFQNYAFPFALDVVLGSVTGDSLSYDVRDEVYHVVRQPKVDYRANADSAVHDLMSHFWNIEGTGGNVMDPVDWGIDPKARGWLWGRATFICTVENLHRTTRDRQLLDLLTRDWAYVKSVLSVEELVSVGKQGLPERMIQNTAHDDAGWACSMYLAFYRAAHDRFALHCAGQIFLNACKRWEDPNFGGSLSYDDSHKMTSSYQTALILAGIRLYELTGSHVYWDKAIKLYNWVETAMVRPDGLYWWIYENGGARKLGVIREACSDTFLGGNMAMGIIHARLYRNTGDDLYRRRALRTADAIIAFETDGMGRLLNDRDAWANALFMGEWVREVLTLPGIRKGDIDVIRRSARSAFARARTAKGYYSGCWNGPAEGVGCAWMRTDGKGSNGIKSPPEQLMVSSNTVNLIVAGAVIEGRTPWLDPRKPPVPVVP